MDKGGKNILHHYLSGNEIIQNSASKISQEVQLQQLSPEKRRKNYHWAHKFQATWSVNNLNKISWNNMRSDWAVKPLSLISLKSEQVSKARITNALAAQNLLFIWLAEAAWVICSPEISIHDQHINWVPCFPMMCTWRIQIQVPRFHWNTPLSKHWILCALWDCKPLSSSVVPAEANTQITIIRIVQFYI